MSKQYARLSQNERQDLESTNYIVKPKEKPKRSCCLSTFVVFAVFVMLCGGIAIVVGIFYTPQVNTFIGSYWKAGGNDSTLANTTSQVLSNVTTPTVTTAIPPIDSTGHPALSKNDTKKNDIQKPTNGTGSANATETAGNNNSTHPSGEDEESEELEDEDSEEVTQKPHGKKHHGVRNETTAHEHNGEILDEAEEKFASWMIRLERFLEKTTGVHRPELVVPLFMMLCFFTSLALASCCCCCMMKRREIQRRRILGKIITDLQTGDSKAVLLDQDGDD